MIRVGSCHTGWLRSMPAMDTVKVVDEFGRIVARESQDTDAGRHGCRRTGASKGQIVSKARTLYPLLVVAFAAIGCSAGATGSQPLVTAAPQVVVAADGCGPADDPVFPDPAASTHGGGLYDVRILDPQADSSIAEVRAAGFVTRVQPLEGRSLRHVSFVKSEAARPSYAVFYLAGIDIRPEDSEASFLGNGGVIVVQTPSDADIVPPLIPELGDRAAFVSIGSRDAIVVHTDTMANGARAFLVQWTSHGYDWRLGSATSAADAIDFARTWECS